MRHKAFDLEHLRNTQSIYLFEVRPKISTSPLSVESDFLAAFVQALLPRGQSRKRNSCSALSCIFQILLQLFAPLVLALTLPTFAGSSRSLIFKNWPSFSTQSAIFPLLLEIYFLSAFYINRRRKKRNLTKIILCFCKNTLKRPIVSHIFLRLTFI